MAEKAGEIKVSFDDAELKKKIARVQNAIGSRNMMEGVGLRHMKHINDTFVTRGFGSWAPLSPNTIASRRKGSSVPLQDTGKLRQSFAMSVAFIGNKVTVGTTHRVAEFHNFGTRPYPIVPKRAKALRFMMAGGPVFARHVKKHPGLPKRQMVPDAPKGKELAVAIIEAFLKKEIEKRG